MLSPKNEKKAKSALYSICTEVTNQWSRKKETKIIKIRKEVILYLITYDMIIYVENPRNPLKNYCKNK